MSSQSQNGPEKAGDGDEGGIPLHLLKNLRKGEGGESGSSNNGEANNSDNSALVSIGNTSFGFNFDSEEHSPNNSDRDRNENSEDSDDQQRAAATSKAVAPVSAPAQQPTATPAAATQSGPMNAGNEFKASAPVPAPAPAVPAPPPAPLVPPPAPTVGESLPSHNAAAADAVANLQIIAHNSTTAGVHPAQLLANAVDALPPQFNSALGGDDQAMFAPGSPERKRKADEGDSSAGYHTDDEGRSVTGAGSSVQGSEEKGPRGKKKKRLDEKKREERNLREKERSLRISKQINELRTLLSSGGVIVPKGTKSSVLTEAANYIRMLQQHQYRSELDRHQLIQQMQMIGNGAHGAQAARAVRHVAAQNGVWSLGNFGGVPPKSAMSFYQGDTPAPDGEASSSNPAAHPNNIDTSEYKFVFNSCGVGMAIASLGGAFIDCNQLFCQLSSYTKQEVCGLTLFNLTARQDLQHAFDLISQMISPPMESRGQEPKPIVLRGSMKSRNDIGLCISLVKGEDGIAKCFCATLIKNPASPFDTAKPIPVSFDAIQTSHSATPMAQPQKQDSNLPGAAPAFTLG